MKAKRKLIGFVAFGLAAVLALALLVTTKGKNAGSASTKAEDLREVTVVVAASAVPAGTNAESGTLRNAVVVQTVPLSQAAPDALNTIEELDALKGQKLGAPLAAGKQVTRSAFKPANTSNIEVTSDVSVPKNLFQMSMTLESKRVLGGKLRPGDHVAVLASYADPGRVTRVVLQKVLVIDVESETPVIAPDPATQATAPTPEQLSTGLKGNVVVTVAVSTEEMEKLTHALEFGKGVWLANQPTEANVTNSQVQSVESVLQATVTPEATAPTQTTAGGQPTGAGQ